MIKNTHNIYYHRREAIRLHYAIQEATKTTIKSIDPIWDLAVEAGQHLDHIRSILSGTVPDFIKWLRENLPTSFTPGIACKYIFIATVGLGDNDPSDHWKDNP